jgi:HAD superfamily hydrolase (TIGR01509 family)
MKRDAQNNSMNPAPGDGKPSSARPPRPIEAIIFDLDGTIIDTERTAALAVEEVFLEWKIPIHFDDATYLTGRTWESAFTFLFNKYPIPVPIIEAKKALLARYRKRLEENLTTVPGSVQAIQSLAAKYPLALVSGSGRSEIIWALTQLKVIDHFQFILGAEDYQSSKPHPEGYLKAMKIMGKTPETCLIFEDSTPGIASARAAGAWVVAVTSTNHFKHDLALAHSKIKDLTAVNAAWVGKLDFS